MNVNLSLFLFRIQMITFLELLYLKNVTKGMCKMIEFRDYKIAEHKILEVEGRIDGVTSSEMSNKLAEIIASGERIIVMDCGRVNFVSSAGLRVLLVSQQKLAGAGGMMIMYRMNDSIRNIFKMSGFDRVFKIVATESELLSLISFKPVETDLQSALINGINFEFRIFDSPVGKFLNFTNSEKIRNSTITQDDLKSFNPDDVQFALGNATIGEKFEDYKNFLGEAFVINHSLFYYPAVARPAVDFMYYDGNVSGIKYNFVDGFSYSGDYSAIISFDASTNGAFFEDIVSGVREITGFGSFGIVLLAESKGARGINIKKVPLLEKKAANNQDIFHSENFQNWFNYPLEPEDVNLIVLGIGIYADKNSEFFELNSTAFPPGLDYHLHFGIFERDVFSFKAIYFEDEVKKVLKDLNPLRIKHMLGKSRFSFGCLGIIKLGA